MTGFIRGLFGGKKKDAEPTQPRNNGTEFFLSFDEARTLGDLEYMRTAKTTKRTFPKGGQPLVQSVSADNVQDLSTMSTSAGSTPSFSGQPAAGSFGNPDTSASSAPDPNNRRRTDTSMDMFRSMAKQVRK